MNSKLTLRLDDELIRQAKEISEAEGKSLSKLVADYFQTLSKSRKTDVKGLGPITRSLRGALKDSQLDKADYRKYLEDKYL